MPPQFNRNDFLEALFSRYCKKTGGFIMVRTTDRNHVKTSNRYFPNTETLAREQYADDLNVLVGVCPRERMRPGKEHIRHMTAVWASIDIGPDGYSGKERHFANERQAIAATKSFPLAPSIIVQSGRGFHLYWLLKEAKEITNVQAVESLLQRIAEFFQCSSEVGIDSFLRLPDTWNPKHPGHPVRCRVQHLDSSARYDFSEFEHLDLRLIIPSKRPAQIVPPLPAVAASRITVVRTEQDLPDPVRGAGPVREYQSAAGSDDFSALPVDKVPHAEPFKVLEQEGIDADNPMIEHLMRRLIEHFPEELLEKLADRIVDKLLDRLLPG